MLSLEEKNELSLKLSKFKDQLKVEKKLHECLLTIIDQVSMEIDEIEMKVLKKNSTTIDYSNLYKFDPQKTVNTGDWTLEEERALLLAIKEHGENIFQISQVVQTRNVRQCFYKIIHMKKNQNY
ncbi:snRNA-activating protein complex subunit 4 [Anaeramoeba flamelloides]|uniref:snRNA-activating protein complex subunit n=1 Tax=Anaeramoeba flamelloides TaxID=1746091 RepID=A0AAV7YI22_9EUKA|nr:snRNA-activating protein complex subunit [Anaeramoeba flamelloides]KAJ6231303.1 snRNA-activating protein complex subunit 4 [Anaeramoeba flamelloides]